VRAEFYRPDAPEVVLGAGVWTGSGVDVVAEDDDVREAIRRIFRPAAVAVDDPALRTAGTAGPVVLSPGGVQWFTAAARNRSDEEGLAVRLAAGWGGGAGFDPAGAYRPFAGVVERQASPPRALQHGDPGT
jgi:hypothetical protein